MAEDGTIEAIRIADAPEFVQWHAEHDPQTNPVNRALFRAFGGAIRERKRAKEAAVGGDMSEETNHAPSWLLNPALGAALLLAGNAVAEQHRSYRRQTGVEEPKGCSTSRRPAREVSVHAVAAMRLLLTGCRKGEILNLLWDQVDMAAGEFRLPDT